MLATVRVNVLSRSNARAYSVRVRTTRPGGWLDSALRRLAREERLSVCAGPVPDGDAYRVTLGAPLCSGGYSPEIVALLALVPDGR